MLNVLFHMVLHHTSDLRCCMVLIVAGSYRSLSLIEFYSTKMTMYQPFHTTCTNTMAQRVVSLFETLNFLYPCQKEGAATRHLQRSQAHRRQSVSEGKMKLLTSRNQVVLFLSGMKGDATEKNRFS